MCDLAYKDYQKGLKYKDIATKYNVSVSAVKNWKSRHWKVKGVQPKERKNVHKLEKMDTHKAKSRGGQQGNKNAIGNRGGGAPKGNKNNLRHGIYSILNINNLSELEKEYINSYRILDPLKELQEIVCLYDILIARSLNDIEILSNIKGNIPVYISRKITNGNNKGLNYTQEEILLSYVYIDERIYKKYELIAKCIKSKGKTLKDIADIITTRTNLELDTLKFEAKIIPNTEVEQKSNLIEILQIANI